MPDTREILLKLTGRETVSDAANKAARGMGNLGDSMDDAAKDTKGLDRELDRATRSVEELRREIARTGNLDLFKDLGRSERGLKKLTNLRRSFEDAGSDSATGFSAAFVARAGPLLARAPLSPHLLAAATSAAPLISAAMSGAILAGAAAGAVGVGAALASKRGEVKKEFTTLGGEITEALTVDAGPMAEPLIEASQRIRTEFRKLRPEFQGIFADASTYVAPLSRALAGAARELVPGLREAVREAEPVVDMLEYKLPAAAKTLSDALSMVTEDSRNAADALSTIVTASELAISGTAGSLALLNKALPFVSGPILAANDALTASDRKQAEAAAAAEKLTQAEARKARAFARSAEEIEGMNQALANAPREALAAEQAALRNAQSWDQLGKSIKQAGRDGKLTSDEYYDLNQQLLDYADSTLAAADATREQTGSQSAANAILDRGRENFLKAAKAANMNADAAQKLADKLFGIPGQRTTKINVNKQQAEKDLASINRAANNAARTRNLRIIAHYTQPSQSGALGAVGQLREKGGPVYKGEAYIVGEKRPEVFVPSQNGMIYPDVGKFTGATASGSTIKLVIDLVGGDEDLKRRIRKAVRVDGGGNVQVAFGR